MADYAGAATLTWTGGSGDGLISSAGNWSPAQTPASGDQLVFAGSTSLLPQLTSNLTFGSLAFASGASAFTLGGGGEYTIGTAAGVTNDSANAQTINNDLKLGVDQTWTAANGNLVLSKVNLNNKILTIAGAADTFINGTISSAGGSLTKTGTGTLTLAGTADNTFTGLTTVNGGTVILNKTPGKDAIAGALTIGDGVGIDVVRLAASDQLNTGAITINSSGLLDLNNFSEVIGALIFNGGAVTTGSGLLTLSSNVTSNASATGATIAGNLALGGNRTFTIADGAAAADLSISAVISGANNVIKAGAGTLVLSGANTYTGTTDVNVGVLNIRNDTALGVGAGKVTTVASGAALQIQGNISVANSLKLNGSGIAADGALRNISGNNTITGPLTLGASSTIASDSGLLTLAGTVDNGGGGKIFTFTGAGNITVSGVISDNGPLIKEGTGVLTLSGVNTYTGDTTINQGTLSINSSSSLGAVSRLLTINAGTLQVTSSFSTSRSIALANAASTFLIDPAQTYTVTSAISGSGSLNKTGAGTMVLGAANTYTGGTNISAGTLQLNANDRIANASALNISGGTLSLQTFSDTVAAVTISNGGAITGSGTLTSAGTHTLQSGSASAVLAGSGAVTKNTAGTVTLTGANTLTGNVTIDAGTLTLAATSGSALGATNAITVNSGGTLLLGENNQINNTASITLGGGTFAKGNFNEGGAAAPGVGALTLTAAGSILDFGAGTAGVLEFASFTANSFLLAINNWTGLANTLGSGSTDRLIFGSNQSANLGAFNFTGYSGATQFDLGGGYFEIVPMSPVPEPSTYAAGLLTLLALAYTQRRRWMRQKLPLASRNCDPALERRDS